MALAKPNRWILVLLCSWALAHATPAHAADASGTWTNTGNVASGCVTAWSGASSYTLAEGDVLKVSVATGADANCSITITSVDLEGWAVSLDSGATWTGLLGTYEGFSAGSAGSIWYRVGTTGATIGSGNYTIDYGRTLLSDVIAISLPGTAPMPRWHQSVGRASATTACESGWSPSWEQWPNDGAGGFVCNRAIPMYAE